MGIEKFICKAGYRTGFFTLICLYCLSFFSASPAYSADTLFTLNFENIPVNQPDGITSGKTRTIATVHLDNAILNSLSEGAVVNLPMPDGKIATGRLIPLDKNSRLANAAAPAGQLKVVSLDNNSGSVEFSLVNNRVTEMVVHDVIQARIYHAEITNGTGQLMLENNDDYYCVRYPENILPALPIARRSPQIAAATPDVATLQNLQSLPGSANVLFIDYWGGSLSGTAWNANYTSNNPINYTAYDTNGNPGSFSESERYSMWLAWREAAEDFAPFNINVTTSRAVYNATAVSNRSQMIVTTTSSWYGNAGGVAYVNVFDDNSNYYKTAWTWNLSDRSMGMTISHEAGHQMGLRHDGIGGQSYYSGHGVWGPIMGAPFGKPYVQWSKGEYPNANRSEDDIAIVTGKLGLISDEAGNGYAAATPVSLPVNNKTALIGFGDTDAYQFSLGTSASVQIEVIPLLGDENESRAANLSISVSLAKLNASGGVISTISSINSAANSPLSPKTNVFEYSGTLGSGTYGLRITPSSPDTNWATGFGSYGIAGEYRYTISSTPQNAPDLTVGSVNVDDNTLTPGQSFTLSATVENQGNASAAGTTLRYYRSTDANITSTDQQLATDQIPALSVNGTSSQNAVVTAPPTTGSYWVGACVDSVSGESDTQNNCSAGMPVTVNPPPAPDLIVEPVTVNDSTLTPGQNFTLSATVENQGNAVADGTTLRYYRSTDANISNADQQLATDPIPALSAGDTSPQSAVVTAPATTGSYWVGACVESVGGESDTQNNCSAGVAVTVNPPPKPDLVISALNLSSLSFTPGQGFTIDATVKNQGNAVAGTSTLRYYRSDDPTIDSSDTQLTTEFVAGLTAGASIDIMAGVSAPNTTGSFWIGVCVDTVANESNTQNNCSAAVQITVTAATAPDLVANSVSLSQTSLKPNQLFNISARAVNRGTAASNSSVLRYFLSDNSLITPGDDPLGSDNIGALDPNKASRQSIDVSAPAQTGSYWIGACVDSVANESNTSNNCSAGIKIIVISRPAAITAEECTLFVIPTENNKSVIYCL